MKYSVFTLAAVAGTALAVAIPDPMPEPVAEPMPWCTIKGQPCWKEKMKLKREAQPEPVADPMPWCTIKGQPCWKEKMKMKREAQPEPEAVADPKPDRWKWCAGIKGRPCGAKAKREAQPEPEAVADPEPDPVAEPMPWCTIKGQPCWKEKMRIKREAQPEPEAVAAPEPANEARWCWIKGQPCWKAKRAVDAVLKAVDGEEDGAGASDGPDFDPSDFNPENFPAKRDINTHQEAKRWCWIKGQPCWKAKRAIDAALHALEN